MSPSPHVRAPVRIARLGVRHGVPRYWVARFDVPDGFTLALAEINGAAKQVALAAGLAARLRSRSLRRAALIASWLPRCLEHDLVESSHAKLLGQSVASSASFFCPRP